VLKKKDKDDDKSKSKSKKVTFSDKWKVKKNINIIESLF
jgi:hypothetical protein